MAKVVIAGRSDCPYFSRIELLGDRLVRNLPSFQLHKIIKTPEEWQMWLQDTCRERGWQHHQSPIVWRELIDRGGKGVLIGGASDFQEYVRGYYSLESCLTSDDMQKIATENLKTKKEIDTENAQYRALSTPLHVCITAADSPMCYSAIAAIASGEVFGPNTEINLRLFDNPAADFTRVRGVTMETQDLCEGLVRGIEVVKDTVSAFRDCSVVVILDELLQGDEESKEQWLQRNATLFSNYGTNINHTAKKNVRVLVAGNGPVNFNTMILLQNAPKIPHQNIVGLARGVENRAKAVIGQRLNVNTAGVVDLIVWGNINGKHFIDNSKSRVHGYDGAVWGPPSYSVPVVEMVHDNKWLEKEYLEQVAQRQSAVETALGHSASGCAARAVTSMLTHWWNGSPLGQMFSLAVCSEGWYGVPEGLVFSYPVTLSPKGYWSVVQDIHLTDESKQKIQESVQDLQAEKEVIFPTSRPATASQADNEGMTAVAETSGEEAEAEETPNPDMEETKPQTDKAKQDTAEETRPESEEKKQEADETEPETNPETLSGAETPKESSQPPAEGDEDTEQS